MDVHDKGLLQIRKLRKKIRQIEHLERLERDLTDEEIYKVTTRQHAICCDGCDKWQHRLCDTGMSRDEYFQMTRGQLDVHFLCHNCKPSLSSTRIDVSSSAPPDTTLLETTALSSMEDQPDVSSSSSPARPNVTFALGYSLGDSTASRQSTAGLFDLTRDEGPEQTLVIHEGNRPDPRISTTLLDDQAVTYEVVEEGSQRKCKKLVSSEGFSYVKKRQTSKSTQWRCSVRRNSLMCYASVNQTGDIFTPGAASHLHPADPMVQRKVQLQRDLRHTAANHLHTSAGEIVSKKYSDAFSATDFGAPRPDNLKRMVNRSRQKMRPTEPKTLEFEVDTGYLREPFLIGDVRVGTERHLVFATQGQLELLGQARRWYLDGTFKIVPKPFVQLWSIHAFVRKEDNMKQLPLVYVLLSKRRKADYVAIFNKILDVLPQAPVVQGFMMDFEAGVWQAVREVFPGTQLKGCVFHWCQAVMRKVAELGMKGNYMNRQGDHLLIRKVLALPFLPGNHIARAFLKLKDQVHGAAVQMVELFSYVGSQWMENSLWTPSEWSVYRQPIRTNNDVEGWHRAINRNSGRGALTFYVLAKLLLRESKMAILTCQLVTEDVLCRHRRSDCKRLDGQIVETTKLYEEKEMTTEGFLAVIGNVYTVPT